MGYSARRGFTNGSQRPTGVQRQQEMQHKLLELQTAMKEKEEAIGQQEFRASAGGGAVEAVVTGNKVVRAITIQPEAVDPSDLEMLQDLVISAVNEALRQAGDAMDAGLEEFTTALGFAQ